MCVVRGGGNQWGLYILFRISVVTPRNHVDLWSNGMIWKTGVYREKSKTGIFLETGHCSLL